MTTPPEITAILNWQRDHAGQVAYSETAGTRLASDTAHLTSTTDCSGMAIRMLRHFGGPATRKELADATYTGNLCRAGQLITTSKSAAAVGRGMLPGDLVFFTWSGHNAAFDHVAIYAGGGRIWNHGGPGHGPLNWSLQGSVNGASEVMVRRYVSSSTPATKPVTVLDRYPYWNKPGHVIGRLDDPSERVHGGIDARERAHARAVISALRELGEKVPTGDVYTREVAGCVRAFQVHTMGVSPAKAPGKVGVRTWRGLRKAVIAARKARAKRAGK